MAGVDVGDVKAIVAAENQSYIVARDDETGLAAGIERLLAEPDERQRLGRANRARAMEDFTNARMFERYDMLFANSPVGN